MKRVTGKAIKYGDNINTDIISPPQYMELEISEAAKYTMSAIDPDFYKKAQKDVILVAGNNFGSGSSRETAPLMLKNLGIKTIVAKSFARIFYRNSINLGLILVECEEIDRVESGNNLEVCFQEGYIKNISRQETYICSKIPVHILRLIESGGLISYLKENYSHT